MHNRGNRLIMQTWPTDKHTIFAMYIYTYIYPYMYIHICIHISTCIHAQRRRKAHHSDVARRHTHDIRLQPLCVSTTRRCATDQPLERQEPTRARKGVAVFCSVCCSILQRVAVCCSVLPGALDEPSRTCKGVAVVVAVCCSVLQCVAVCCPGHGTSPWVVQRCCNLHRCCNCCGVCCSVLQCIKVCCGVCCSVLQRVVVCWLVRRKSQHVCTKLLQRVLQCVLQCCAVCCSVLQCVVAHTCV